MKQIPMHRLPEIVKLGGSLLGAPRLRELLALLAEAGAPLVIVAGGGTLADGVRALQPQLGFSDEAAHRMAILAMQQTALALSDIEPRLTACADADAIARAHEAGRAALWLPAAMALEADVPASWDVTSDSLAAWLALRLGAGQLTLVKAAPVADRDGPLARWATLGLVDPHFPLITRRFTGIIRALSFDDALDETWHAKALA